MCLVKDASARPPAAGLLKTEFIKVFMSELFLFSPRYRDAVTTPTPSPMTSLTFLLLHHYSRYYDITNPSTMTSLPVTSTIASLPPLL